MFMALILPAFRRHSEARAARMKARILSGSFTPGALSTPEETSTPGARVMRSASATFSGIRPPDSMNGIVGSRSVEQVPVERLAEAAGPRSPRAAAWRRTAGGRRVRDRAGSRRDRRFASIASAFITGRPKRCLDRADALRRLLAVQLEHVGLQRRRRCRRASRRPHRRCSATFSARPFTRAAELARRMKRHVARPRRKEHEAHHVGAGIERGVERVGRGQAADFDESSHLTFATRRSSAVIRALSPCGRSRRDASIDPPIAMKQPMPQGDHAPPRNFRLIRRQSFRDLVERLSDDRQAAADCKGVALAQRCVSAHAATAEITAR